MSSSLELADVYRSVVEHAAATTGATQAALTRLDAHAGELRTVATLDPLGRRPGARRRGPAAGRAHARRRCCSATRSLMHAPIELGPRLYGVLSVGARAARALRRGEARPARAAGALLRGGDRERDRLPARAPHRALAHARASCRSRCRRCRTTRPGCCTRRRWASRPAATSTASGSCRAERWPRWSGDVAGKGVETAALSAMVRFFVEARSWDAESPARVLEQTNAMLAGRLPSDTLRDRVPGRAGAGLAALGERGAPAAAAPVRRRGARAGARPACRSAWTRRLATASASSSWPTATSCSRTPTAWSRRGAAARPTGRSGSRRWCGAWPSDSRPSSWRGRCTTRSPPGRGGLGDDAVALALRRPPLRRVPPPNSA